MTNGDNIRRMTNGEIVRNKNNHDLAKMMECPYEDEDMCISDEDELCFRDCNLCIEEWLNKESNINKKPDFTNHIGNALDYPN